MGKGCRISRRDLPLRYSAVKAGRRWAWTPGVGKAVSGSDINARDKQDLMQPRLVGGGRRYRWERRAKVEKRERWRLVVCSKEKYSGRSLGSKSEMAAR